MRDYRNIVAFQKADELVVAIYQLTALFPSDERFGLTSQLRRAAVSVPSNIVEGSARSSQGDFVRFLDIAFGSLKEVEYQLDLAKRLEMTTGDRFERCISICDEAIRVLHGLRRSLRSSPPDR